MCIKKLNKDERLDNTNKKNVCLDNKEELQKERMSLAQIKEPTEKETKNNNPQLTLGGK